MPQKTLLEALAEAPDPRADNKRHPLPAILSLSLAAVLGGATTQASEALALLGLTPAPNEKTLGLGPGASLASPPSPAPGSRSLTT
jgi:hypothetical protein